MNVTILVRWSVIAVVVCFTGCVKHYDLVKSEFPQSKAQPDKREITCNYRRNVPVYDGFQTKAIFSALWLSDPVRTAFVDVYGNKRGYDAETSEEMIKRQLEDNNHWLTFYLLADIRDKSYTSLSEKHSAWTVFAEINHETKLMPELIKEVELEPEYQLLFGKSFNYFKTAYIVKFPIKPEMAQALRQGTIKQLDLVVGSIHNESTLSWEMDDIKQSKRVLKDEDFYWC